MPETMLTDLKVWFKNYTHGFMTRADGKIQEYELKIVHTHKVCAAIREIAEGEAFTDEEKLLAEICALLHDVGRFEQYARYGTFYDLESEDHALLGLQIIAEHHLLNGLKAEHQETVVFAIRCHNQAALPDGGPAGALRLARLLRDADKLDIWRVVTDYYRGATPTHRRAVELGLAEGADVSDAVYEDLRNGRLVLHSHLKTVHDFRLLQLSWVYDLNYPTTLHLLKERHYLDLIIQDLPETQRIQDICNRVLTHINK